MKISWPNILNLILLAIILLIFLGFFDTQKPINVSEGILGFMKQSNARAALVIADDGRISAINQNGDALDECSIGPNGKVPQCKGLGPNGTVLSSQMFNILHVRGSGCFEIIGGDGKAKEYCWE